MSEELQSLVQIMELYGRGLGGLGKAIRFSTLENICQVLQCQPGDILEYRSK